MVETRESAFEALVAEHRAEVLRLCRSILRDEHLASDAAQETFVKLWQGLQRGPTPENLPAWLRRVAATTALDLARRRAVRGGREAELHEQPARAASPVDDVSLSELEARLQVALGQLSEGQRTVFRLRHEGGLRLREVAAVLGVSLSTARTQFARACVRLQERLLPHDSDSGGSR